MRLGLALLEFNFPPKITASDNDIESIAVGVAEGTVTLAEVARWLERLYACSNQAPIE